MTERLDDARWRAAVDAVACGEANAAQVRLAAEYVPPDGAARLEHELLRQLATLEPEDAAIDEALVAAAVARFVGPVRPRSRGRGWIALVAVAASAVLALGIAAWPRPETSANVATRWGGDLVAAVPAPVAVPETSAAWNLVDGELAVASAAGDATRVPPGTEVRARTRACASRDDARVCVDAGGAFVADGDAFELAEGRARVTTGPAFTISQTQVVVAGTRVVIAPESEVVIRVERRSWSVEVVRGRASLARDGGELELVAGERVGSSTRSGPGKPRVAVDEDDLLARARALRSAGDLAGAAKAYEKLIDRAPRSAVAASAQVSLGEIQLARGRAREALAAFERYLRGGGPLAEEAAYGRIRALRALGRDRAADDAAAAFVRRYPGSAYAGKLRPP